MSIAHTWLGRVTHPTQQIRVDLMSRLWPRRARTAIERLYPHPPHQRFDMPTADLAPLGRQQASQHSRAGEGELKMLRGLLSAEGCKIGRRHVKTLMRRMG